MCNQLTPSSLHCTSTPSQSASPSYPKIIHYTILVFAILIYISFIAVTVGCGYISWPIQLFLVATSILVCTLFLIFKFFQSCKKLKSTSILSKTYPSIPSIPTHQASQTPSLDSLTFQQVGSLLLKFQKISSSPINRQSSSVTLQGPHQVMLHFHKGHPFDDPFLSKDHSALLLTTNSSGDLSLSTGRTLSVSGSIHRESWSAATQGGLPIGHCTSTLLHQPSRAYAMILINPPTIETLIPESIRKSMRRAVTFQDFALEDSFNQWVQAYTKIFAQCRHLNARSLQLEVLGIQEFSSTHEQFAQWEAFCHLALLEALQMELNSGLSQLKSITINDRNALPMRQALSHCFN